MAYHQPTLPPDVIEHVTKEQLQAWEEWNKIDRKILNIYLGIAHCLCIVYQSQSGVICVRIIDREGIWAKVRYYASYNPETKDVSGFIAEKRNTDYHGT